MDNILTPKQLDSTLKSIRKLNKKIVLAGGCFDIIHLGHITFLQKAKQKGDVLIVLLESDKTIKKLKGHKRPINSQKVRAKVLSSLKPVDFVILLPDVTTDGQYDELVKTIKPQIIAVTKGDPNNLHKIRQAEFTDAKVVVVTNKITYHSTTKLARQIFSDFD